MIGFPVDWAYDGRALDTIATTATIAAARHHQRQRGRAGRGAVGGAITRPPDTTASPDPLAHRRAEATRRRPRAASILPCSSPRPPSTSRRAGSPRPLRPGPSAGPHRNGTAED